MDDKEPTVVIYLRVPKSLHEIVTKRAKEDRISINRYVIDLLTQSLLINTVYGEEPADGLNSLGHLRLRCCSS